MLPLSLDCPFLIAPSVFYNVYFFTVKPYVETRVLFKQLKVLMPIKIMSDQFFIPAQYNTLDPLDNKRVSFIRHTNLGNKCASLSRQTQVTSLPSYQGL